MRERRLRPARCTQLRRLRVSQAPADIISEGAETPVVPQVFRPFLPRRRQPRRPRLDRLVTQAGRAPSTLVEQFLARRQPYSRPPWLVSSPLRDHPAP